MLEVILLDVGKGGKSGMCMKTQFREMYHYISRCSPKFVCLLWISGEILAVKLI